jgi:hypothetical protein
MHIYDTCKGKSAFTYLYTCVSVCVGGSRTGRIGWKGRGKAG